jgi:hypothetical protein
MIGNARHPSPRRSSSALPFAPALASDGSGLSGRPPSRAPSQCSRLLHIRANSPQGPPHFEVPLSTRLCLASGTHRFPSHFQVSLSTRLSLASGTHRFPSHFQVPASPLGSVSLPGPHCFPSHFRDRTAFPLTFRCHRSSAPVPLQIPRNSVSPLASPLCWLRRTSGSVPNTPRPHRRLVQVHPRR